MQNALDQTPKESEDRVIHVCTLCEIVDDAIKDQMENSLTQMTLIYSPRCCNICGYGSKV